MSTTGGQMSTTGGQSIPEEQREGLRKVTTVPEVIASLKESGTFGLLCSDDGKATIDTGHSVTVFEDRDKVSSPRTFYFDSSEGRMSVVLHGDGTGTISMRNIGGSELAATPIETPSPTYGDVLIAAFVKLAESLCRWGKEHIRQREKEVDEKRAETREAILRFAGFEEEPEFDR